VLLHAASKQNTVQASIDGREVTLQKIKDDQVKAGDYVDFSYFYADVSLGSGVHTLALKNTITNSVLVDSASLMPANDLPANFTQLTSGKIAITPTIQPLIYDLRME
jgi:hypothetical protein